MSHMNYGTVKHVCVQYSASYHSLVHSDMFTTTSNYGNTVRSVVNVFNLITHCAAPFPNSALQRHYSAPEMYDCYTLLFLLPTLDISPSHIQWQLLHYRLSISLGYWMTAPVGNKHPLSCQCTSSNGLTVIACITMWGSWWLRRFTTDLKQSFAWTGELPILSQISIMRPHSSEVFFSSVAFSEIWQDVQQELLNGRTVDATNCQAQSLYGRFLRETWYATQPSQFVTSTLPSGTPNQLLE
jgi:hypothetical protein